MLLKAVPELTALSQVKTAIQNPTGSSYVDKHLTINFLFGTALGNYKQKQRWALELFIHEEDSKTESGARQHRQERETHLQQPESWREKAAEEVELHWRILEDIVWEVKMGRENTSSPLQEPELVWEDFVFIRQLLVRAWCKKMQPPERF